MLQLIVNVLGDVTAALLPARTCVASQRSCKDSMHHHLFDFMSDKVIIVLLLVGRWRVHGEGASAGVRQLFAAAGEVARKAGAGGDSLGSQQAPMNRQTCNPPRDPIPNRRVGPIVTWPTFNENNSDGVW
jgi:hypothetical protein